MDKKTNFINVDEHTVTLRLPVLCLFTGTEERDLDNHRVTAAITKFEAQYRAGSDKTGTVRI